MKKLNGFSISEYEITKDVWDAIKLWGMEHGYDDLSDAAGYGKKPAGGITWYDAVKFCNALSEFMNLEPCYYTDGKVYKTGKSNLSQENVKNTNGYRLPTAKEWEHACRGCTETQYFWGDDYIPLPENEYAWCGIATQPCITHEVGLLKPNPYGLYDMAGNVFEWCFDKYKDFFRIMMGGSVAFDSIPKSGFHTYTSPKYHCYETGMRVVSDDIDAPNYECEVRKSTFFGKHLTLKPQYTDMSDEAIAERLCNELGDGDDALYVKMGKTPEEILKRYRDLFIKRLSETEINEGIHYSGQDFDKEKEEYLKYDFNVKWYGKSGQRDVHHLIDKPTYLGLLYSKTGDRRYWDKCMELYYSMLVRHKAEFDCLDDEMLTQKHQTEQSWAWNNGFEAASRCMGILSAFWNAVNCKSNIDIFPPDIVAQTAVFIMCDNLYTMIKDGRINIFNQVCHSSRTLLKLVKVYSDFKIAPTVKEIAEKRLEDAFSGSTRKDGAPLEQSYMYNGAILSTYNAVKDLLNGTQTLKILEQRNNLVERYLAGAIIPTGGYPALSTSASTYPPDMNNTEEVKKHKQELYEQYHQGIWKEFKWSEKERIVNALLKEGNDTPKYKNLHFPYGGITILRSGWEYTSQMIYFFSAPAGRGHAGSNINEIQMWYGGMPMLVSAGGYSYKIKEYCHPSQLDIIDDIDDYQHTSYGRNTLTCGKNQKRLESGENNLKIDMENVCGYKYYESKKYVYTEGIYDDGYVGSKAKMHKRQLIYDIENMLLYVFDTIDSPQEECTQCWHFMPKARYEGGIGFSKQYDMCGYENDDIKLQDNIIFTDSSNAPNIFMYQFSSEKLTYERKYKELNPASGWLASDIQSKRVPKTDIRVKWTPEGESTVLTVIAVSKDTQSPVRNILKMQDGCELTYRNGEKAVIEFTKDSKIKALFGKDEIVINGDKSYIVENGQKNKILAPSGFSWKEENGYSFPCYTY